MAVKKESHEKRLEKKREKERLTNWYMINMSWGMLGIVLLYIVARVYERIGVAVNVNVFETTMWIITGLLAVGAVVVLALGMTGKIKNKSRAINYSIFLGVCTLFSIWVVLWRTVIRNFLVMIMPFIGSLTSYWGIYFLILAIVAYLIAAFFYYLIKLNMVDKGKR